MIGHDHTNVHSAIKVCGEFGQVIQIASVVFLGDETAGAVIAALDPQPVDAGLAESGSAKCGMARSDHERDEREYSCRRFVVSRRAKVKPGRRPSCSISTIVSAVRHTNR